MKHLLHLRVGIILTVGCMADADRPHVYLLGNGNIVYIPYYVGFRGGFGVFSGVVGNGRVLFIPWWVVCDVITNRLGTSILAAGASMSD